MLAPNFMTAKTLAISDQELAALISLLGVMERGELQHVEIGFADRSVDPSTTKPADYDGLFNMGEYYGRAECGTAACMAGVCDYLFATKFVGRFRDNRNDKSEIFNLFHPPRAISWRAITVDQAAAALRNYLVTGKAQWHQIIPKEVSW